MRILLLTNKFPPDFDGGYELNAWKVANGLRTRGHVVEVATSKYRDAFKGEREYPNWVHRIFELAPVPPAANSSALVAKVKRLPQFYACEQNSLRNMEALKKLVSDLKFDLVYVFNLESVGYCCGGLLQELGHPVLWHFGDIFLLHRKDVYEGGRVRALLGSTVLKAIRDRERWETYTYCAFVSRILQETFASEGITPPHYFILPRGIEVPLNEAHRFEDDATPRFMMASRICHQKGIHVALAAAAQLADRRSDLTWELELIGSGDAAYEEELRAFVDQSPSLQARVRFAGRLDRPEVMNRMKSCTAFISASIGMEPFANTITEALAMGAPLIASEEGSIYEVIEKDRSALTYPKLSPEALSAEMERILVHPTLRQTLSTEGVKRIKQNYTMEAILDKTESTMEAVIALHAGRRLPQPQAA